MRLSIEKFHPHFLKYKSTIVLYIIYCMNPFIYSKIVKGCFFVF